MNSHHQVKFKKILILEIDPAKKKDRYYEQNTERYTPSLFFIGHEE